MKKEGIMRINSYNKFFAEVAKIMNTSVKAVKILDGRYKVELANHVYLNVYIGVSGSLFIHDHRGNEHITSCYDFEDFKTMKDLYERLVTDCSESDTTDDNAATRKKEVKNMDYLTQIKKNRLLKECSDKILETPFLHNDIMKMYDYIYDTTAASDTLAEIKLMETVKSSLDFLVKGVLK